MAAADHRQGRRRHHEAHEAVGHQARDHGDDEPGLPHDLAQGPAAALGAADAHRGRPQERDDDIDRKAKVACPRKPPAKGAPWNASRVQITV